MAPTDAITRRLELMAADARGRGFGVRDGSQTQAMIRHGYLLALEEIERALDDFRASSQHTSRLRHDAA